MTKHGKPKRIVMFAFDDAQIIDISGPSQLLGAANRGTTQLNTILGAFRARFQIEGKAR